MSKTVQISLQQGCPTSKLGGDHTSRVHIPCRLYQARHGPPGCMLQVHSPQPPPQLTCTASPCKHPPQPLLHCLLPYNCTGQHPFFPHPPNAAPVGRQETSQRREREPIGSSCCCSQRNGENSSQAGSECCNLTWGPHAVHKLPAEQLLYMIKGALQSSLIVLMQSPDPGGKLQQQSAILTSEITCTLQGTARRAAFC